VENFFKRKFFAKIKEKYQKIILNRQTKRQYLKTNTYNKKNKFS